MSFLDLSQLLITLLVVSSWFTAEVLTVDLTIGNIFASLSTKFTLPLNLNWHDTSRTCNYASYRAPFLKNRLHGVGIAHGEWHIPIVSMCNCHSIKIMQTSHLTSAN